MVEKEINPSFQVGRFQAMGCPCEILLDTEDTNLLAIQLKTAKEEALRIEKKYSRYLSGNILDQINQSHGKPIQVDPETALILNYAAECYELSDGLFDITTGVSRKIKDPKHAGWTNVQWNNPILQIPVSYEIDLGGICKEYASDRILYLLMQRHSISTLVNLGGDIATGGNRLWSVGIEDISKPGHITQTVSLRRGGIATSGTTKRLGHIINPKTLQAVQDAPQSVTVAAKTCTEAGFWSTLAILKGAEAESFLETQQVESWCYRSAA